MTSHSLPAPAGTDAVQPVGPLLTMLSPSSLGGDQPRSRAGRDRTPCEELSAAAARAGVPAALMVSATVPRTGVRATGNSGRPAVTCSYLDASFSRAEEAVPGRDPQTLLAVVMPGARTDEARVFVDSRLHPAVVASGGRWRAYALEAHGLLLLAVVPNRPGAGTAPHLRLVGPATKRITEARGSA
ncbi:hypothetical protein ACIQOV_03125 [Kitasatospora sp. NPDC091257]|uniref:hypothetical protein n=1 Tax=unclassified Kitasatospora TaxID=2633591 RepID=UPI002F90672C